MSDLISIITPTYNRADLLGQTIESVLAQTYPDWELIIIDDGSADNTSEVVSRYLEKDGRIKYFYQENRGLPAARNSGIRKAAGKYLAFLDADDLYFPDSLKNLWGHLHKAPPKTKLVYGDFIIFYDNSTTTRKIRATPPFPRPKLYLQFLISGGNPIVPSATMVEKKAVIDVGMFNESFFSLEDAELWSRLILKYDIAKVDAQIVRYRKHHNQLTKKTELRRYNRDRQSLKLFSALELSQLFPHACSDHEMSIQLDRLAKIMLKQKLPTYDTALHILKVAQEKHFRTKRERYIRRLEKSIRNLLDRSMLPS
jgi:glycosyltransferase involved in cell wall biosynthesis